MLPSDHRLDVCPFCRLKAAVGQLAGGRVLRGRQVSPPGVTTGD